MEKELAPELSWNRLRDIPVSVFKAGTGIDETAISIDRLNKSLKACANKVLILGEVYEVLVRSAEEDPKLEQCIGYCEQYSKKIVISDMADANKDVMAVENIEEFKKKVLRHEIIHAFFGESGLRSCSEYAEDEELIDWMAIQFPKILKAFEKVGAL